MRLSVGIARTVKLARNRVEAVWGTHLDYTFLISPTTQIHTSLMSIRTCNLYESGRTTALTHLATTKHSDSMYPRSMTEWHGHIDRGGAPSHVENDDELWQGETCGHTCL